MSRKGAKHAKETMNQIRRNEPGWLALGDLGVLARELPKTKCRHPGHPGSSGGFRSVGTRPIKVKTHDPVQDAPAQEKAGHFFQSLEESERFFPIIGKNDGRTAGA